MVGITIHIPTLNLMKQEHFCFRYFNHRNGSPHTFVPHILKEAVAVIYDDYIVNKLAKSIVTSWKRFICNNCDHAEDEPVNLDFNLMIPQLFMNAIYPADCLVPCVSIVLLSLTTNGACYVICFSHYFYTFTPLLLHLY